MRIKQKLKRLFFHIKYRKHNVFIGKNSNISKSTEFDGCNRIGQNSIFSGRMGYASYLGNGCIIVADIGKFCSIAPKVSIIRGKHPVKDWVSTHPAFFSPLKQCGMAFVSESKFNEFSPRTKIGNDVWIGESASIMEGIKIGDGAIIGAGAIVTKDIPPYAIAVGVPAKVIKYRFSEEEIEKLLALKWWDKPIEWIKENADKFEHVDKLLEHCSKEL